MEPSMGSGPKLPRHWTPAPHTAGPGEGHRTERAMQGSSGRSTARQRARKEPRTSARQCCARCEAHGRERWRETDRDRAVRRAEGSRHAQVLAHGSRGPCHPHGNARGVPQPDTWMRCRAWALLTAHVWSPGPGGRGQCSPQGWMGQMRGDKLRHRDPIPAPWRSPVPGAGACKEQGGPPYPTATGLQPPVRCLDAQHRQQPSLGRIGARSWVLGPRAEVSAAVWCFHSVRRAPGWAHKAALTRPRVHGAACGGREPGWRVPSWGAGPAVGRAPARSSTSLHG